MTKTEQQKLYQLLFAQGLALVSRVEIPQTDDLPYHVECERATEYRHIFHLRGKAFVLVVKETEHTQFWEGDTDKISKSIEIQLVYNLRPYRTLLHEAYEPANDSWGDSGFKDVPGFNVRIPCPSDWVSTGSSSRDEDMMVTDHYSHGKSYQGELATPEEVSEFAKQQLGYLRPLLAAKFNNPIQITYLAPIYSFLPQSLAYGSQEREDREVRCQERFLAQFDRDYFYKTCGKLWLVRRPDIKPNAGRRAD